MLSDQLEKEKKEGGLKEAKTEGKYERTMKGRMDEEKEIVLKVKDY